ncbi:MAG: DNA-binding protein Alba [Candidatus Micrarchaeota archaeon]
MQSTQTPLSASQSVTQLHQNNNTVYIGKKNVMAYVLAIVTSFNKGAKEVVIKARGSLISRAVDTEEILKHKFLPDVKIKNIVLLTEKLESREGYMSNVSAIEIMLTK